MTSSKLRSYITHSLIRDVTVEQESLGEILTVATCLRVKFGCVVETLSGNADQELVFDGANNVRIFQAALGKTPFGAKVFGQNTAKETKHTLSVGYCSSGRGLILYFIIF